MRLVGVVHSSEEGKGREGTARYIYLPLLHAPCLRISDEMKVWLVSVISWEPGINLCTSVRHDEDTRDLTTSIMGDPG